MCGDYMSEFRHKKKFGQNFLNNSAILDKIISKADINSNSLVLEVGPGKGALTEKLASTAKNVLCYEIDTDLNEILSKKFSGTSVKIIFDDFLNRDLNKDISCYKYDDLYFVSNVPYYITTPILMKLMSSGLEFKKIVMMVQEEVGERFSACVGSKNYGSITVYLNYFFNIKREFKVSRNNFTPVPNVDSEVVSFTRKDITNCVKNKDIFYKLIRDSFQFKRKTIRNNLKKYNLDVIEEVLKKNDLSLSSRAEQIPVDIFVEISNKL